MGFFSGILKGASKLVSSISGGDLLSAGASFLGQESANATNVGLSRDQMAFQERMSSTAHQREVKDLIAAGLNPMLSAKLGGSSTPPGASAHVENSAAAASKGATDSATRRLVDAQILREESQASLNSAQAAKATVEARAVTAQAGLSEHDLARREHLRDRFDSWTAEGREMQARESQAVLDRYISSNGHNAEIALRRFAMSKGYESLDEAMRKHEFRMQAIDEVLHRNKISQSQALSDFYKTDFGKEVAPYLSSAESLGRMVRDVAPSYRFSPRYGKK